MNRVDVYRLIDAERNYQKAKWGDKPHPVTAWLVILQRELWEAVEAWAKTESDAAALDEIRQVVAVGVAALEQHGAGIRARAWGEESCPT